MYQFWLGCFIGGLFVGILMKILLPRVRVGAEEIAEKLKELVVLTAVLIKKMEGKE